METRSAKEIQIKNHTMQCGFHGVWFYFRKNSLHYTYKYISCRGL